MKAIHPLTVNRELQDAYLRYVDTTYWLRHPDLMAERRELLTQYGRLFTEFHLEPIAQYDATIDLLDFASKNGVPDSAAAIVGEALFRQFTPDGQPIKVREHQAKSLASNFVPGVGDGRNAVITSGVIILDFLRASIHSANSVIHNAILVAICCSLIQSNITISKLLGNACDSLICSSTLL